MFFRLMLFTHESILILLSIFMVLISSNMNLWESCALPTIVPLVSRVLCPSSLRCRDVKCVQ